MTFPDTTGPLPALPPGLRLLSDEQAMQLDQIQSERYTPIRCVTCGGSKSFRWYRHGVIGNETADFECPCDDQYVAFRYFSYYGIELRYQRLNWGDIHPDAEVGSNPLIKEYIDNFDNYLHAGIGLVLTGNAGSGKTMVAALMLKKLMGRNRDFTGRMIAITDLINRYTDRWDSSDGNAGRIAFSQDILRTTLLVVDDVAREWRSTSKTDAGRRSLGEATLEDVFRHRAQACLPTVITTNQDIDALTQVYGPHVNNVLHESSQVVDFPGTDGRPAMRQRTIDEAKLGIRRPIFYSPS